MIKKVFWLGAFLLLLTRVPLCVAAGAQLRSIDVHSSAKAAQVTLVMSGTAASKVFTLRNPERLVVDFTNTRLASGVRTPAGDELVSDIRTGVRPHGGLRLVIQLRRAAVARTAWIKPGRGSSRRFVISFGQSAGSEPAAAHDSPGDEHSGPGDDELKVVRAAHAPGDSARDVIIAVDAGHGGQDPGAIGRRGTREKDVTLAIARALAARINDEPGMRAVLTRDRDEFIELRDRIRRARAARADMFVSIHADSIADRSVSGASVYVLSEKGATNEAARWLAERENAADLMGGVKLDDKDNTLASVLLDLSQSANISASMSAARRVLTSLDDVGQVRKPQVQQAGFVVLKSPDIPSMLVETAYISNPSEEKKLATARQQGKLADAIFQGVRGYFDRNPPAGTRFAQSRQHSTVASVLAAPSAGP